MAYFDFRVMSMTYLTLRDMPMTYFDIRDMSMTYLDIRVMSMTYLDFRDMSMTLFKKNANVDLNNFISTYMSKVMFEGICRICFKLTQDQSTNRALTQFLNFMGTGNTK
jgi:hypothetical protein